MGKGPTFSIGSVTSSYLNMILQVSALKEGIPLQPDVVGRDTGTDAMAGVLSCLDCANASIGIPIRNMHTISETGVTDDVQAAIHLLHASLYELALRKDLGGFTHPDLRLAEIIATIPNKS
mmetsp:Transcript_9333/g.11622  ORF Transcript_9333/g.11622 Transcript_9333/m.11622 type:complete len:121 (+) Transcript_9333:391-753(+)